MKTLSRYFISLRGFVLQWHITERCNWRCRHCYREKEYIKELPLNKLFEIFLQYIDLIKALRIPKGHAHLNIAGGEPFIRDDFFQFLELIHKHNKGRLKVGLLSNGSLITRKNAFTLKSLGVEKIQLSLEGMQETNDSIRGNGAFDKITGVAKILIDVGILTDISLTLIRQNITDLPSVVQLCDSLGIHRLGIRRFVPIGRGKQEQLGILNPKEQRRIYHWRKKTQFELKAKNSGLHLTTGCEDGIFTNSLQHRASCAVIDGRGLTLFPNGDVLACRRLPIKVGNALQKSLLEIYFSSDKLWWLRNLSNAHSLCQGCSNFKFCHGGAPCITYAYFGRFSAPDPQCWRVFTDLPSSKLLKGQEEKTSPYIKTVYVPFIKNKN